MAWVALVPGELPEGARAGRTSTRGRGAPARRYYQLTSDGFEPARAALARAYTTARTALAATPGRGSTIARLGSRGTGQAGRPPGGPAGWSARPRCPYPPSIAQTPSPWPSRTKSPLISPTTPAGPRPGRRPAGPSTSRNGKSQGDHHGPPWRVDPIPALAAQHNPKGGQRTNAAGGKTTDGIAPSSEEVPCPHRSNPSRTQVALASVRSAPTCRAEQGRPPHLPGLCGGRLIPLKPPVPSRQVPIDKWPRPEKPTYKTGTAERRLRLRKQSAPKRLPTPTSKTGPTTLTSKATGPIDLGDDGHARAGWQAVLKEVGALGGLTPPRPPRCSSTSWPQAVPDLGRLRAPWPCPATGPATPRPWLCPSGSELAEGPPQDRHNTKAATTPPTLEPDPSGDWAQH